MADRTRVEDAEPEGRARRTAPPTRAEHGNGSGPTPSARRPAPATRAEDGNGTGAAPSDSTTGYLPFVLPPALHARYTLVRELGRGGEATVWLADEIDGTGQVAIKVFAAEPRYEVALESPEYRRSFRPEHTVRIYERGTDHGVFFEVMEYCSAGTLDDLVRSQDGGWPASFIRAVAAEVGSALHSMHPVVHGDVKPSNILIRTRQPLDLVLTDFGLTVNLGERSYRTNTGRGSIAYTAPGGMDAVRASGDWWGLGMTLLDLALGRNVFQHDDGRWVSDHVISESLATRPVPLEGVGDAGVRLVIRGLLVRDPALRWTWRQVEEWLEGGQPHVPSDSGTVTVRTARQGAFPFEGRSYDDPAELGAAMRANPDSAGKLIAGTAGQRLAEWVDDTAPELRLGAVIKRVDPNAIATGAAVIAQALDPDGPPTYRGADVSDATALVALAQDAQQRATVSQMFTQRTLHAFSLVAGEAELGLVGERWEKLLARARPFLTEHVPVTVDEADLLALSLLVAALDGAAHRALARAAAAASTPLALETAWYQELRNDRGTDRNLASMALILAAPAAEQQATEELSKRQEHDTAVLERFTVKQWEVTIEAVKAIPYLALGALVAWVAFLVGISVLAGMGHTAQAELIGGRSFGGTGQGDPGVFFTAPLGVLAIAAAVCALVLVGPGPPRKLVFTVPMCVVAILQLFFPWLLGVAPFDVPGALASFLSGELFQSEAAKFLRLPLIAVTGYVMDALFFGERLALRRERRAVLQQVGH